MSRRVRFNTLALSLLTVAIVTPLCAQDTKASSMRVYVGTYTQGQSQGIYTFLFDSVTGKPGKVELAAEQVNPSFVAFSPDGDHLYAVNEVADFPNSDGTRNGGVTSFAVNRKSGKLIKLNSQLSGGTAPCHLVVDATGQSLIVANYGTGSVGVFPIDADGSLKPASCKIQHSGSSINPRRQEGPHAHSVNIDANNKFAVVADLGLDKLLVYQLDADNGSLSPNDPSFTSTHPGAGPRHFSFHPNGKFAYSNNEMQSSVTAYQYDSEKGVLNSLMTHTTLPVDYDKPGNSTAEALVHPSGKFLYVSNRGHNSIAMFRIRKDGTMKPLGQESTRGEVPRNFGIDPTGNYLLAANQNSGTIVVFEINPKNGKLKASGEIIEVPTPVCVRMFPVN